ncbi:unnamed protein product, partial [marine sediment metagenome]
YSGKEIHLNPTTTLCHSFASLEDRSEERHFVILRSEATKNLVSARKS